MKCHECGGELACTTCGRKSIHIGSDFNEFYIEALEGYIKYIENKLKDIECAECGKNLLECKCEEGEWQ